MAPALTQESQPELLLPYLTTPPYTPSPPSSLVASTSAPPCATTSSTSPLRSSCTNMEVPPYGGHERQHSPTAAAPLDTNTSDDAPVLSAAKQDYKIENFDDNTSVDQRIVSVEPTPPHSTDSSAPLSPLPEKSHAPLSPLQKDKPSASPVSSHTQAHHLFPIATSTHNSSLKLAQDLHEKESMPCSFTFTRDDLGSVSTACSSSQFGLLSPSSPDKTEASPSSFLTEAHQVSTPEFDPTSVSSLSTTLSATVAPNLRVSVTVTATATVSGVAVVSDTPVVVTASASVVDSTTFCTTGVAAISKASLVKPGTVSGVPSSFAAPLQESSPMGCSVPKVDNRVGSRCSAPQPNDTPPPPYATLSLPSKITAPSGIFDDGLLSTLPDDCFRTLDHLVSANPELLNELSNCPGSSVSNNSTVTPTDVGSSASSCAGTTTLAYSNPTQLIAPNTTPNAVSGLSVSSEGSNSLTSYASAQAGPVVVPTVTPVVLPMTPEVEASTILSSLSVRQLRLQKRQAQLLRRARRLTGRGLASSVSTQLSQLIKYGRPLLMADVKTVSANDGKDSKSVNILNASPTVTGSFHQPPPPRYDAAALKGMSTANLISYVRQMETRSSAVTNQKLLGVEAPTSHLSSVPPKTIEDPSSSVSFSENLRYELQTISGEVKASARLHVEHDSDATESSSGGESCDEFDQDYNGELLHSDFKPISDRALYRYETTRAVIASRWGWLEAQIADVECKIHQHARAHLRLRHLNRYNTSSLSDHSSASRTATNPVLANRPAYTCVTRTNINGINSGVSINGATATTHVKNGASDSTKPGLVNNSEAPRKGSNNSNDSNVPRLNTTSKNETCSKGVSDANSDAGGPRLHTKEPAAQRVLPNETSGSRTSNCAATSFEGTNDDGCARTKGLRWHRKRRWIRVGNIFEHGRGRAKDEPTQSDVANNLVFQPTLSVSCRCVEPMQCVMCTTLKARCNVPSSGTLYSNSCINTRNNNNNSSSSNNNSSNNMSQVNGMQTPLKKALSSASLSPSPTHLLRPSLSPLQFTPPRCSGQYTSSVLLPSANSCPPMSRIPSDGVGSYNSGTALRGTNVSTQQRSGTLRSVDTSSNDPVAHGTTLLCKNAWYPRVASSSRVGLSSTQLLHERLASTDLGHHPLLSSDTQIPVNARTESILKSRFWCSKVASLVTASNESATETSDSTSLSGVQASSLPGYCGLSSSSSRRHKSNNGHRNNNRRHRRHGDDAVADDELYTPHKSSAKKKKKSKDRMKQRSKDREEKRKEKKKKAFKRKEKLEQKGRLTLRLRKSSVTGELVATPSSLPDRVQLYHHDHQASSETGRSRGRHSLPFIPDDVSSLQSSRASSPSLPPHSPVDPRSVLQLRGNVYTSDARPLSRNNATRPLSPADVNQSSACSPSPVTPRTPLANSFSTGSRARNNTSKPAHVTLDRCVSSSAESGAAPGIATRRATVHSSLSTALSASANTGPLSAPVVFPASPVATSSATSGPTVTPAAAAAVALRIKQGAASYDIDNIVIPYNMASVTRVELIEYKEIVTPKWREIDEPQPLLLNQTSCPVLEEDVCDTTVIARHEKSEELERLRFAAHLTTGGSRHGGNARVRQRSTLVSATTAAGSNAGTSSTGTNTPDNPLSPHVDVSDLATPPATPLALSEDSNHSSMSAQHPGVTADNIGSGVTGDKGPITDFRCYDGNQDMGDEVVSSIDTDKAQGSYRANKSLHDDPAMKADNPGDEIPTISVPISSAAETVAPSTVATFPSVHAVSENSHGLTSGATINTALAVSPSVTASVVPSGFTNSTSGVSQSISGMLPGPRKLRNAAQTTTRLRTYSNNSSVNFNDEEGNTREVSPYPIRKFPLSDSQFASMVQENNEVISYAAIAAANHSLLRSLDYDDLGEPSSDEHEHEPDHADDASEAQTGKKRKNLESSVSSPFTEADAKKRQKKNSQSIVVQDASDDSGLGIAPSLSNLPVQPPGTKSFRRVEESHLRSGRNAFTAVKKPSALVTFKEHLKKTNEGECGSEGRSSPLSEVTDSAAEDEMTGDLSDSSKPPDWTISATADSAGHCVMQVLRH